MTSTLNAVDDDAPPSAPLNETITELDLTAPRVLSGLMLGVAVFIPSVTHSPFECPMRALTGIPCPGCGMTRSVVATVHGDLARAIEMTPFGIALVAVAIALLVTIRWRRVRVPTWTPWLLAPVVAAMWAFQLWKYATGRPL